MKEFARSSVFIERSWTSICTVPKNDLVRETEPTNVRVPANLAIKIGEIIHSSQPIDLFEKKKQWANDLRVPMSEKSQRV